MPNPERPRIAPTLTPAATTPVDVLLAPEPREPTPPPAPPKRRRFRPFKWLFWLLFVAMLVPPAIVLPLRWLPPPTTAFMLQSEVKPVEYEWVDANKIPETLRLAAVAAEDQKFWNHFGFDLIAIAEALEHNEKSKKKRGASTISQQTAKNLFLWPSRSWLRKGLEVTFTVLLEVCWTKERILEVYLNVAEFGPGIYGVQAAAQHFFKKDSEELSPLETARLVAVLPNPRKWSAKAPGPYVQQRVDWIMAHIGYGPPPELEPETGEPILPVEPQPSEGFPPEPGLEPEPEPEVAQPATVPPSDVAPAQQAPADAPPSGDVPAPEPQPDAAPDAAPVEPAPQAAPEGAPTT